MGYSIKEVSQILNLPTTTLRYYDKEGLLPFLQRMDSGYRLFSDQDISLLRVIECLKRSGMSIRDIRQFTAWLQLGDASLQERYEMFLERRRAVEAQLEALQNTLDLINHKCWYYETAIAAGTESVHSKDCASAAPSCVSCQQT